MPVTLSEPRDRGKPASPGGPGVAARRPGAPAGVTLAAAAAVAVATLGGCATAPPPSPAPGPLPAPDRPLPEDARSWVEETLESLDVRERAAQLVMVWMTGGYASRTDPDLRRIRALVDRGLGGVVISVGTPHDYVSRLNRLQEAARVPLLVAADFEAGAGYRIGSVYHLPTGIDMGGATVLPPAMAFGAAGDEGLAREAGRITGREARALGVHLGFAPVLDVNNNPANPIINTRSYGEDPKRVAALGVAYIRGAREAGLLATAKHFPGHGDTEVDSHVALPIVPGDRARLDRLELVPFRAAVDEGLDAIMTAHVAAPGILGEGAPPATLSPRLMTTLLREEMGFDGVLVTDALDMGAIVEGYGDAEAAVLALEAGADILLMPLDPAGAIEAVAAAVASGRLSSARLEASVRRVLRLKARAGLHRARLADPGNVTRVVGTREHRDFADSVARRAVTLVRDMEGVVPLPSAARRILSVTYAPSRDVAAGRQLDAALREAREVETARLEPASPWRDHEAVARRADSADVVVISAYASPPPPLPAGPLPAPGGAHGNALDRLLAAVEATGTPTVLVSFTSPYLLGAAPDPTAYLLAWDGSSAAQRAAAGVLLGAVPTTGRLPISLPPLHVVGEGLRRDARAVAAAVPVSRAPGEAAPGTVGVDAGRLGRVDRIIEQAVRDGAIPGAALAVGRRGRLVRLRGYGRLDPAPAAPAVTDSTLYDLASLTKVVGTTTAILRLADAGRLGLDDPVGAYLPEWSDGWKADVTIRDLLLHRGGLPPFRPFWRELRGRAAYRAAIADLPPAYAPGTRTVYSDIGFMTLGFLAETVTGTPLDELLEATLFDPLGMEDTRFRPPADWAERMAPTEVDTVYRMRHVRGEVHDENAHALGGVAGHAGLFSSARDLARFGEWILAAVRRGRGLAVGGEGATVPDGAPELPTPTTLAAATRRAPPPSAPGPDSTDADLEREAGGGVIDQADTDPPPSRALGWDTPSGRSSSGRFFPASAFGHTGFTGTSLWVDPARDLFVVLLTNRVNPTRENLAHIPLRRAVHDAVATAIIDLDVRPRSEVSREEAPDEETPGRAPREARPAREPF